MTGENPQLADLRLEATWQAEDACQELARRAAREKNRRELQVRYYRIGHTLAFCLPVSERPTALPAGIPGWSNYPWTTWLAWALEERWRVLQAAWRHQNDVEAGALLQAELGALAGWQHFRGDGEGEAGSVSLVTGHIAAALSLALGEPTGWDQAHLAAARAAAGRLIENDIQPWFQAKWHTGKPLAPHDLHNIPFIALVRGAQLARTIGSPAAELMEQRAREAWEAWCRYAAGPEQHTEGAAYDGYLMDSISEWLSTLPDFPALASAGKPAAHVLVTRWLHLGLPGCAAVLAPVGDVEPEMPFWCTVLARFGAWYRWDAALWLWHRIPLRYLPAAALALAVSPVAGQRGKVSPDETLSICPPAPEPRRHPGIVTLRTGWGADDILACVSASSGPMGHLHLDGGHLIVGWQGRFWVTDPGYQQFRPGEEREYTIGIQAHNSPVIEGAGQKRRAALVSFAGGDGTGSQQARIELAACYADLDAGAWVTREVWLLTAPLRALVVRDSFAALPAGAVIDTYWQIDASLAFAFAGGWARLSDGERAIWLGASPCVVAPENLERHSGSRGALTLKCTSRLPAGQGVLWRIFWFDDAGGWEPPALTGNEDTIVVDLPKPGGARLRLTAAGVECFRYYRWLK